MVVGDGDASAVEWIVELRDSSGVQHEARLFYVKHGDAEWKLVELVEVKKAP
jgi:hypothetical protein